MIIPNSIRHLASRYKTGAGHRGASHEFHNLKSLSARLLCSPAEALNIVAEGALLALDSRNGSHMFSATALDAIRNRVIDFIAGQIVTDLTRMGASEQEALYTFERAISKQHELSRSESEVIYFDQNDEDNQPFSNGVRQGAGLAVGATGAGLAGYALYKYLKNRNQGGQPPQLGNLDLPPKGPSGSGGAGASNSSSMTEAHPPAVSAELAPKATMAALPNAPASNVAPDLLNSAIKKGRAALGYRGKLALDALKRFV